MLTRDEARALVLRDLRAMEEDDGTPLALKDELTIERPWGWVFFYDARDPDEQLFGNAPILINRETGELAPSGTAAPAEVYIRRYERTLLLRRIFPFLRPRRPAVTRSFRFPATMEEAERVFRRWDKLNGRYYVAADVMLENGAILTGVTFDGDSGIAVEVSGRPIIETPRWIGAGIADVLVLQDCSAGTLEVSRVTEAEREAFAGKGRENATETRMICPICVHQYARRGGGSCTACHRVAIHSDLEFLDEFLERTSVEDLEALVRRGDAQAERGRALIAIKRAGMPE